MQLSLFDNLTHQAVATRVERDCQLICPYCALAAGSDKNTSPAARAFDHPATWGLYIHQVRRKHKRRWVTTKEECRAGAIRADWESVKEK